MYREYKLKDISAEWISLRRRSAMKSMHCKINEFWLFLVAKNGMKEIRIVINYCWWVYIADEQEEIWFYFYCYSIIAYRNACVSAENDVKITMTMDHDSSHRQTTIVSPK